MDYQGSKRTVGKDIVPLMLKRTKPRRIVEPFLGGGGFLIRVLESNFDGEIIAGDYDPDITALFKALRMGWLPPRDLISEEEWEVVMNGDDFHSSALRGFTYFASLYFGNVRKPRYTPAAYMYKGTTNWEKQWRHAKNLSDLMMSTNASITFIGGDYRGYEEWLSTRTLVYCDPPYAGVSGYKVDFDIETFWDVAAGWATRPGVSVYVSEYEAPKGQGWRTVWHGQIRKANRQNVKDKTKTSAKVTERLFQLAA